MASAPHHMCTSMSAAININSTILSVSADGCTNGRAYATVLRPSVCPSAMYLLWLNGASYSKNYYWQPIGSHMRNRLVPWSLFKRSFKAMSTIVNRKLLEIVAWFWRTTNRKWFLLTLISFLLSCFNCYFSCNFLSASQSSIIRHNVNHIAVNITGESVRRGDQTPERICW